MDAELERLADPERGWRELESIDVEALLDRGAALLGLLPAEGLPPRPARARRRAGAPAEPHRDALWSWLDATRRADFLRRIAGTPSADRWLALVLAAIDRTHYTVPALLQARAERTPEQIWLRVLRRDRIDDLSLATVQRMVEAIQHGFGALFAAPPAGRPVAFLAENSPETICADLACLTGGLVNVTIPADATGEQAAWILEQTESAVLVVGSDRQLEKMLPLLPDLPALRWVVRLLPGEMRASLGGGGRRTDILTLDELITRGAGEGEPEWFSDRPGPASGDPATLMYTSGTTGLPKGIIFAHRQIVFKRFCRALAWPEIGEGDRLLCYLPLYHTFGRWLEMTGSLFWGASYAFMENPSLEALLDSLRRAQPTLFISIPKRWIQLRDRIREDLPENADARAGRAAVARTTGGFLRFGLSAAGYLDPEVFRFFQRHGIELMSGFGMTEATGGITMTPPGRYREGTVGRPLPGIEVMRADDGELLIRGSYVMKGYFGPEEGARDYREEWFPTGDLVEVDDDGFVTIVDRKKDIYKNVRGQTVAPQRVESLFQSFAEIRQAFLVGDGREYNTLLLWPDLGFGPPALTEMSPETLRDYLNGIVVTVNGFLAPFERVLDFALLPRPLDLEHEELTPKGTFRRKVVEEHFADLIEEMYRGRAARMTVGPLEVRIPHWWLREIGLTLGDLSADAEGLLLPRLGRRLPLEWSSVHGWFRCGDLWYEGPGPRIDLEKILRAPTLWLGNHALVTFTGAASLYRPRRRAREDGEETLRVAGLAADPTLTAEEQQRLQDALWREDRTAATLHLAAVALPGAGEKEGQRLVALFEQVAGEEDALRSELARIPLRRAVLHRLPDVRSMAFRALLPPGAPEMVGPTMIAFLAADPAVLNASGAAAISRRTLPDEIMQAFLAFLSQVGRARGARRIGGRPAAARRRRPSIDPCGSQRPDLPESCAALDEKRTIALLGFVVRYASDHPAWFKAARHELSRWYLAEESERVRETARRGLARLRAEFRRWLGSEPRVAIDPLTGREYGWRQALRFDPGCDAEDAEHLSGALEVSPIVREAVFVLSGGARVSLAEIPEGGVRVRHLGTRRGKAVYRLSVQTRQSGTFEIAVNLARGMALEEMEEELRWLVSLGSPDGSRKLVEEVGGFWPEHRLWTEEFVPGDTVARLLEREMERSESSERLLPLWIHLASSACTLYVELWERTGRRLVHGEPGPENLIVPAHDYQEGARLVSISGRRRATGLADLLGRLRLGLIETTEERFPVLRGVVGSDTIFAAVIDVLGEGEGRTLLGELAVDPDFERHFPGRGETLALFRQQLDEGRYIPRRLAGAVRRYHRWAEANPNAAPAATARTLRDLWDSYALSDLEAIRPETRLRLFRETVFAEAEGPLRDLLDSLVEEARSGFPSVDRLMRETSELVRRHGLPERQVYFLARLTYAHLRPEEPADLALVEQGGTRVSDLVITHRDRAGRFFRVRHASNPREVWSLHRLFFQSGIRIRFRAGHQFLVAVDEDARVLGGLVYHQTDPDTVHMEKIVVAPTHRRQGISEQLMEDFFRRLRSRGVRAVTTGFFRPQYFRMFRFKVDREHAGLVRMLDDEPGLEG